MSIPPTNYHVCAISWTRNMPYLCRLSYSTVTSWMYSSWPSSRSCFLAMTLSATIATDPEFQASRIPNQWTWEPKILSKSAFLQHHVYFRATEHKTLLCILLIERGTKCLLLWIAHHIVDSFENFIEKQALSWRSVKSMSQNSKTKSQDCTEPTRRGLCP